MKGFCRSIIMILFTILLCGSFSSSAYASFEDGEIEVEDVNLKTGSVQKRTVKTDINMLRSSEIDQFEECVYPDNYVPPISGREIVGEADSRTQVTNTTVFPYSAICSLVIEWPDGKSPTIGTGTVITKKSILTSGHCVYLAKRGGYATKITVYPGRNGSSKPLGKYVASELTILTNWRTQGGAAYDAAFIKLGTNIGSKTGIMGYANYSDSFLLGSKVRLSGYAGDKPSGTVWTHAGKVSSLSQLVINYKIDATKGQSGSPVFRIANNQVVGVHSRGNTSMNYGKRIDASFFSLLKTRKNEDQ